MIRKSFVMYSMGIAGLDSRTKGLVDHAPPNHEKSQVLGWGVCPAKSMRGLEMLTKNWPINRPKPYSECPERDRRRRRKGRGKIVRHAAWSTSAERRENARHAA
jgi:hypothetical protein